MRFVDIEHLSRHLYQEWKKLYNEAFPPMERKPLAYMKTLTKQKKMVMQAIIEDDSLLGLVVFIQHQHIKILDYFAIVPSYRGCGYGRLALQQILHENQKYTLILEIEKLDDNASNALERQKRKQFYLKQGLKETNLYVCLYHVDYELLCNHEGFILDVYKEVLYETFGKHWMKQIAPTL